MSWLCRDPAIFEEDLEVLDFEPTESRLFLIKRQNNALDYAESWTIKTCADWKQWLETDRSERQCLESSRLNLVIAGRAEFPWKHDPSALSTLPWSYQIFSRIQRRFLVHSGIVRTINRNTSCMFSPMSFEWNLNDSKQKSLVYLCRTTASWSGDMALSVTFIPSTLTTNAVLFGCDLKKPDMYDDRLTLADIITSRLKNSDTPVFHPMMLPTIFADVERDRQIELVREKLEQLGRRIDRIAFKKPTVKPSAIPRSEMETLDDDEKAMSSPFGAHHLQQGMSTSSGSTTLNEDKGLVPPCTFPDEESLPTAKLWQQISRLRVGLSNWRRQLLKMISHVEDLNRVEFAPRGPFNSTYREEQRLQFFLTGERIRDRLQELVDEYDEYIRECSHIMDGFSLATQLEISQIGRSDAKTNQEISRVNLDVAKMTRRDGSIMKSIAVLGMIFLPASFATAFFSMDFFDLPKEGKGGTLSSLFWIYVLAAVLLTLGTVTIFYFCILKKRNKEVESDRSSTAVSLV